MKALISFLSVSITHYRVFISPAQDNVFDQLSHPKKWNEIFVIRKVLELIIEFSKVTGYKINTLIMKNKKEKVRKQSHSPLQQE